MICFLHTDSYKVIYIRAPNQIPVLGQTGPVQGSQGGGAGHGILRANVSVPIYE